VAAPGGLGERQELAPPVPGHHVALKRKHNSNPESQRKPEHSKGSSGGSPSDSPVQSRAGGARSTAALRFPQRALPFDNKIVCLCGAT